MSNKKTYFIAFEGGDATGKSSQVRLLENVLKNNNLTYIKTREPGGTEGAEKIRDIIFGNDFDVTTDTLLYMASRHENVKNLILPSMGKYDFILCDRFILSTLVYQGVMGNFSTDLILEMHKHINNDLYPDLTLILDADIEKPYSRLQNRIENNTNKLDKKPKEWHIAVRKAFNEHKNFYKGKTAMINSALTLNETHKQIIKCINNNLGLNIPL